MPTSWTISPGGDLTGGGSGAANRTITLPDVLTAKTIGTTDAANDSILNALRVSRATSHGSFGTYNLGAGIIFEGEDDAGVMRDLAAIAGVVSYPVSASIAGHFSVYTRDVGSALVESIRFYRERGNITVPAGQILYLSGNLNGTGTGVSTVLKTFDGYGAGDKMVSIRNSSTEKWYCGYSGSTVQQGSMSSVNAYITGAIGLDVHTTGQASNVPAAWVNKADGGGIVQFWSTGAEETLLALEFLGEGEPAFTSFSTLLFDGAGESTPTVVIHQDAVSGGGGDPDAPGLWLENELSGANNTDFNYSTPVLSLSSYFNDGVPETGTPDRAKWDIFGTTVQAAAIGSGGRLKFQLNGATMFQIPDAVYNVTGSKGGNAALASLIAAIVATGLITDGSS